MLHQSVIEFAERLTAHMTSTEPSAHDVARARKLKKKLEELSLLDIYHPHLQPIIVEYLARELAAARHASPAAARKKPPRRRPLTKR